MKTGEKIRELRKAKGMTQEELGKVLGVQKSAIAKYENGRVSNLKRSTIRDMCELFNVEPTYFFDEDITVKGETEILIEMIKKMDAETVKSISAYARFLMGGKGDA